MKAHWLFVLFAACNSADDSSDGETDGDGDGFTTADDCDDAQASVHPGADEVAATASTRTATGTTSATWMATGTASAARRR